MDEPDPLEFLRKRANELANTGRYPAWPEVEEVLIREVHPLLVGRLAREQDFTLAIDTRCRLAKRMRSA
jgi:hypothetical protein